MDGNPQIFIVACSSRRIPGIIPRVEDIKIEVAAFPIKTVFCICVIIGAGMIDVRNMQRMVIAFIFLSAVGCRILQPDDSEEYHDEANFIWAFIAFLHNR